MESREKLEKLEEALQGCRQMALAFSRGVDSTFLLLFTEKNVGRSGDGDYSRCTEFCPGWSGLGATTVPKSIRHKIEVIR